MHFKIKSDIIRKNIQGKDKGEKMNYTKLFIEPNLPKPLKKEELEHYFELYKLGEETAREELIKHNIKLVIHRVLKRFPHTPYDQSELVSIGLLGLINSVDTFDMNKNFSFTTYAIKCIDNEILMFMRNNKKHIAVDSLEKIIHDNEEAGSELRLKDALQDESVDFVLDYERKITIEQVRESVEKLSEKDKKLIKLYWGFLGDKRYNQREIAEMSNKSSSLISRNLSIALNNLEEILIEAGVVEESNCFNRVKKAKKLRNIYEYFNEYSEQEIDEMISKLSEEDKQILRLRYGEDLKNPNCQPKINHKVYSKFYSNLVPKMKRNLKQQKEEKEMGKKLNIKTEKDQPLKHDVKDDYIKILEVIRTCAFEQMLKFLTPKEATIVCLRLGFVDGKYFSKETIAKFLDIETEEVDMATVKVLQVYKENITEYIDRAIISTTKEVSAVKEYSKKYEEGKPCKK